jgi:hypothetical protein
MPFAERGGAAFTESMKERFSLHFGVSFDSARVLGAFAALKYLDLTEDQLFGTWVPDEDLLVLNCQSIKRIDDVYVVNYDIPALLHKNNAGTDIAVMMLRSTLSNEQFHHMITDMGAALREKGIVGRGEAMSRAFHYSRGPFEQLLDARSHLYDEAGKPVPLTQLQFCRYLADRGLTYRYVEQVLERPILEFRDEKGEIHEECLFPYTAGDSYEQAWSKLRAAVGLNEI